METLKGMVESSFHDFYAIRKENTQKCILHLTGTKNISLLLKKLIPYLIVKRKQAETMLEYCKSRLSHYRGKSRRYSKKEIQLYKRLIKLNKRGR